MDSKGLSVVRGMEKFMLLLASVWMLLGGVWGLNMHWCPLQCECYNDFQTSDCSRRMLNKLPLFTNLTKRIYAENNYISDINYATLHNLNNLLVLNLQNNSLTYIDFKDFCGLASVIEINLSRNKIAVFSTEMDMPCRLPRMTQLHLNYNRLTTIPHNLSVIVPNLRALHLAYNNIHSVRFSDDFANFHHLQLIDLSGNPVHDISQDDLAPLSSISLESFKLSDCMLHNLSRMSLFHLNNVTSISLSRNLIYQDTLANAFALLGVGNNLQHLDLSEMRLDNITVRLLSMFSHLVSLDISHSSVKYIQPELFTSFPKMATINLEGNYLLQVPGLNTMPKLTKLFARDNKIKEINLTGLNSLEIVDLSGNRLSSLPSNWLNGIHSLHVLNLSNNVISTISHRAFHNVMVNTLDLSFNNLISFHRYGLSRIQNLYLSHNSINRLTDNAFDNMEAVLEELDLSYNEFTQFQFIIERDFIALQRLILHHNQLGTALKLGHLNRLLRSLTHLQVLDMSYNQIVSIPRSQVINLHHLTTLILEGNLISHLEDLGLNQLNALAKLVVADNLLQSVQVDTLQQMDYLEELDLSKNPFHCSCHLIPLQLWLNTTLVMILNNKDGSYQCATPSSLQGRDIQWVHPDQSECLEEKHLSMSLKLQIIGAVSAIVFILILLSVVTLYYSLICSNFKTMKYRWQVRYREVSAAGAEFGGEIDPDIEPLTVENVYANNTEA